MTETNLKIRLMEVLGKGRVVPSLSSQIVEDVRLDRKEIHVLVFTDVVHSIELLKIMTRLSLIYYCHDDTASSL